MRRPHLAGSRVFNNMRLNTVLPDGTLHRQNYKAPPGGGITTHLFPVILEEHRKKLASFGKFKEIQTGPNSFNFIYVKEENAVAS